MKKERNLFICFAILCILYALLLTFLNDNFVKINWFYIGTFILSLFLFVKSYVFRSDSSLFLATSLLGFSFLGTVATKYSYNFITIMSFCVFILAFSNFSNYVFFNKIFNFYCFLFFILLFLPLILFSFNCINLILMISSLCGVIILFAILQFGRKYE